MAQSSLLKEVTQYGDRYMRLSEVLFYSSERSVEQYKKMRMYPMCWMGLNFIKLGLPDVPFSIECDEDVNIKLLTEKMFKKFWKRMIREALESLDFGFKACEIRYQASSFKYQNENEETDTFDGMVLRRPKGLDGETIEILIDEPEGSLRGFRQNHEIDVLVKDRKALLFTHNLESGNYYGISAQEPIYPFWYDANINRQFHMRWLERKGTGIFKGIYPVGNSPVDGTDTDNQDVMLDLLDGIMEGTAVSLPSGRDESGNLQWDISILDSEDKTDPFIERAKYLDETILRGLVIPEKALTQGEVGARASIEAFQDLFINRKQDILDQIVDTIDRYLLPHFVELNFGQDIEVHVRAGKLDDDSKFTASEIVKKLIEKGSEKVEQQWLIDKTGIPLEERKEEIDPDEIVEFPEDEIPLPGEEIPSNIEEEVSGFSDSRWRALTKREQAFKMSQLGSFLDDESAKFQKDMTDELLKQADRIKGFVDRNFGNDKPANIANKIEIKKSPIKRILRNYLQSVYDYSYSNFKSSVEGVKFTVTTDNTKDFIGFRSDLTSNGISTDIESSVKYQTMNDLSKGIGKLEVLENIINTVKNYISARLPNVAETEIGFTLDKSNNDYYIENQKKVKQGLLPSNKAIVRFQYSAILDNKVCPLCAELDGTIVEGESPIKGQYATPIHYMCRCAWLPITEGEVEDPRYAETDLSLNKKGKPMTLNDMNAKVGNKIELKTFCFH